MTTLNEIIEAVTEKIAEKDVRAVPGMKLNPDAPCVMVIPKTPFDIFVTYDDDFDVDLSLICVASANVFEGSQQTVLDWISRGPYQSLIDLFNGSELIPGMTAKAQSVESYGLDNEPSLAQFVTAEIVVNIKAA